MVTGWTSKAKCGLAEGWHLVLYRPVQAIPAAGSADRPVRHLHAVESPRPSGIRVAKSHSTRLGTEVYRRRRLLAGGLVLLFFAAVVVAMQLIQAGIGGGPLTTTGAAAGSGMIPARATAYVVRPGDTLWTIAAVLAPGRDERPVVDQLAKQMGGSSIYPGEVIALPSGR